MTGPDPVPNPTPTTRVTALVSGQVQGVGFRWWTRSRSLELGLVGWAKNLPDGRVEVVAEGTDRACRALVTTLRGGGTPGRVDSVVETYEPAHGIQHAGGKYRFVER